MLREEAIALLTAHDLAALTREMRESLLVDWRESDDEIGDPMDARHDPLLLPLCQGSCRMTLVA